MSEGGINPKSLLAVLRGALDRRVKQRSRDTIVSNAIDDPSEPLVQRVTEPDACDHCKLLGNSRPIKPRQVAREYHQYCKCHIALVFRKAVKRVRRTGQVGHVTYIKKRRDLELHERIGLDMLTLHGISPTVLAEDHLAAANIDLLINERLWEMKNVTNHKASVKNQLKRAREKWEKLQLKEPVRVVFTTYDCRSDFSKVVESVRRKQGYDEAIVVSGEEIVYITK